MSGPVDRHVEICDSTLRDGNHAVRHQLTRADIERYARAAEAARIDVLEVGHGNGLAASSLQVGQAALGDQEMIAGARQQLHHTKLGVMSMPGVSKVAEDVLPAVEAGVDEVRVGAHCTEADITRQQVRSLSLRGVTVKVILMMSHMASAEKLLEQGRLVQSYGACAVVLMDSAGAYSVPDVARKVTTLVDQLDIAVGFHAHDNRGLAVANTLAAIEAGATIVDVTARGFGAGAGNTPLELLVANLHAGKLAETQVDLYAAMDAAELAASAFIDTPPTADAVTIASGLAGVFSGFAPPVRRAAERFDVDARDILFELGRRGVVAGQEDAIVDVARHLHDASLG